MRKRFRKITAVLLIIVMIVLMIPFSVICASAITQSEFDNRLNNLRNQYPNYSTWYDSFDGGTQCFGFARLVAYNVFGSHVRDWEVSYSIDGVKAGDVLQYGNTSGSGHTVFVTAVTGDTITFVDCNGNGNYSGGTKVRTCGIKWDNTINKWGNMYGRGFSYRHVSPAIIPPVPDNLRVGVSGSEVYMNWDWDGNADYYDVKLWREKIWEGDPYRIVWSVKSNNYAFALPKGTYQAYVDAGNYNTGYYKMSNVVTFSIGDVGINLSAGIYGNQIYLNWNSDNSQTYNLKVYKEFAWDGELYENIWNIKETSYALALPKGRYQAYIDGKSMSNVIDFTVTDENPKLKVNVVGNQVYFNWNSDNNAKKYHLKIYKGHAWQIDAYEIINNITTTKEAVALPAGTYQAYLDAEGDDYWHMGNVIEFTVTDENPKLKANVVGNQVYFNWNPDNKAQKYHLKIYKGHAWQIDAYEIINNITTTKEAVALPAGTYQAYLDAEGDDYWHMGNVIEFTVGNSEPVLTAKVKGNQVDFSWTKNSKAKLYHLKIWEGHAWMSAPYLVKWNLVGTKETVMLPKGRYQAYIDAVEDNTTVMGNVIDIVVEADNYQIPVIGDTNLDGIISISDVTAIQRHLAELELFTDEQLALADTNGDGEVDISDATHLQKYLAEFDGIILGKQS